MNTSGAKADGRFDKADLIYDPVKNEYRCAAGESLIWRFASVEKGMKLNRYWTEVVMRCLKGSCHRKNHKRNRTRPGRTMVMRSFCVQLGRNTDPERRNDQQNHLQNDTPAGAGVDRCVLRDRTVAYQL